MLCNSCARAEGSPGAGVPLRMGWVPQRLLLPVGAAGARQLELEPGAVHDTRGLAGHGDEGLGIGECGVMGGCGAGTAGRDVPQRGSESRGADGSVVLQQLLTICLSPCRPELSETAKRQRGFLAWAAETGRAPAVCGWHPLQGDVSSASGQSPAAPVCWDHALQAALAMHCCRRARGVVRLQCHSLSSQVPGAGPRRVRLLEWRGRGDLKLSAEPAIYLQQGCGGSS